MTVIPRLHAIYREAGLLPLTGHSPNHMHDWSDAPFTRFFDGQGIVGCAGLSVFEVMFLEHLSSYLKPRSILVIGNAHGWSTIALALIFPEARVLAIDPDEAGITVTNKIAQQHGLNISAVRAFSPDGVKSSSMLELQEPIDLVLIDALHTNEAIVRDFQGAAEVADPGAVYVFHDVINWKMVPGLKQIQQQSGLNAKLLTRTPSGMAMVYREMSEELEQYVNCFTDEPQLLTAYRDIVRKSFSGDVLGEALLQL